MSGPVRFSAHLAYLFTELPLEARFAAAAAAGFDTVEHPAPFDLPASRLRRLLDDNKLRMAQISSGLVGAGRKGLAAVPGQGAAFRDGLARALDYAEEIGCPLVHPMAGIGEGERDRQAATWRENISHALEAARSRPVAILVEAIAQASVPGYVLDRLDLYLALTAPLAERPKVLVDSYHAACNGEDAPRFLRAHPDLIGHVHIADCPGRHEPGSGAYDFGAFADAISDIGYRGAVGLEYVPAGDTLAGLGWRTRWPGPFG